MFVQYSMQTIEAQMNESDCTYEEVLEYLPTPSWYCETNITKDQGKHNEANYYTTLEAFEQQSDYPRDMITIISTLPKEVEKLQ